MNNIVNFVLKNWSPILEYALMFLAYFFVFLYRNKIQGTRNLLQKEYKHNRSYVKKEITAMRDEREREKAAFDTAVKQIETLSATLKRHENALRILTNPMEVITDDCTSRKDVLRSEQQTLGT